MQTRSMTRKATKATKGTKTNKANKTNNPDKTNKITATHTVTKINKKSIASQTKSKQPEGHPHAQQVFDVPELAEQILLHLDRKQLYRIQAVSKQFNAMVAGTPSIQRKLLHSANTAPEDEGPHVRNLNRLLTGKSLRVGAYIYDIDFLYSIRRPGGPAKYYLKARVKRLRGSTKSLKTSTAHCDLNDARDFNGSWRKEQMSADSLGFEVDNYGKLEMEGGSTLGDLINALLAGEKRWSK